MKLPFAQGRNRGFTLIEVLVVLAIITIVAALFLPTLEHAGPSHITRCMNNLKQIGLGEVMWTDDNTNDFPSRVSTNLQGSAEYLQTGRVDLHFQTLAPYIELQPQILRCPIDKRKAATNMVDLKNTNISYFVSLDSTITNPASVVAGDCYLEINGRLTHSGMATLMATDKIAWSPNLHGQKGSSSLGNVLCADGHVESVRQESLPVLVQRPGIALNQLAFP